MSLFLRGMVYVSEVIVISQRNASATDSFRRPKLPIEDRWFNRVLAPAYEVPVQPGVEVLVDLVRLQLSEERSDIMEFDQT